MSQKKDFRSPKGLNGGIVIMISGTSWYNFLLYLSTIATCNLNDFAHLGHFISFRDVSVITRKRVIWRLT